MDSHKHIALWSGRAPQANGDGLLDQPTITVHLPDKSIATGAAILVCPGGGYRILAADHEGLQVANWLNQHGIAAFVLQYRLGPKYSTAISLLDGRRAMRWIRSRAREYGVSKNRIGMLGFSAGGHLTANVGTHYDAGDPASGDPVDQECCRPDFLVPVYAVINGEVRGKKAEEYTPTDKPVTSDTPPAFLVHTHEDRTVPASQSLLFYEALRQAGVQAEMHIFGHGDHGLGLGTGDPDLYQWPSLMLSWLRRIGMMTEKPRIGVSGKITLAGKALGGLWITLIPQDPDAPLARVKINRDSAGYFEIDAKQGPTCGIHQLVITHISERYPQSGEGTYTLDDSVKYERFIELNPGTQVVWDIGS